jgi:hypothetical protein
MTYWCYRKTIRSGLIEFLHDSLRLFDCDLTWTDGFEIIWSKNEAIVAVSASEEPYLQSRCNSDDLDCLRISPQKRRAV